MKHSFAVPFLALLIFITTNAQNKFEIFSQEKKSPGIFDNIYDDFNSTINVGWDFVKTPLSYNKKDLLLSGIILGVTALSFTLDNPVRKGVARSHSKPLDKITNISEKFGNHIYGYWLSGIMYAGGHIFRDKELRLTGLMLAEVIYINGLVTHALKVSFGRARPFVGEGNGEIDFLEFEFEENSKSLPSGHTSTAFAIATVLSQRINNLYASAALYSFASLTAFQRIYDDKHWISDTILGAAIGTLIGLQIVKLHSEYEADENNSIEINIVPYYQNGSVGFGASLMF